MPLKFGLPSTRAARCAWPAVRVTDTETITQQINYAFVNRGLSYESEGTNRGVPVNFGTVAERDAVAGKAGTTNYTTATAALPGGTANVLPGTGNHASSDGADDEQGGYIFRAVLNAGGTVRNYGMLTNNIGSIGTKDLPISDAFARDRQHQLAARLAAQRSLAFGVRRREWLAVDRDDDIARLDPRLRRRGVVDR